MCFANKAFPNTIYKKQLPNQLTFLSFFAFVSPSTLCSIGALFYMTSDQRDCACEGNKYYFSFLTVKNLQRILPIGQFSFSKFSTLNVTGVEEATFSRKNVPVDRISLFHSFGEATSNHCALCSPVISEASLLLRNQRDSQCCPQYMGISSLSLTGGRDYRNYRPHRIASSGNQTELQFWRQVYSCISQSHLQLLQTYRAYQVEEVILPSHMWDRCSVTCPSPTPKAIRGLSLCLQWSPFLQTSVQLLPEPCFGEVSPAWQLGSKRFSQTLTQEAKGDKAIQNL